MERLGQNNHHSVQHRQMAVASPSMAFYASVAVAVFVLAAASLPQSADAFECYVGDGSVMRRKMCPSFGTMGFSDVCFKRIGGERNTETQRGCFNSLIGAMIIDKDDSKGEEGNVIGCHKIPEKLGTGDICLCDTRLCNGAVGFKSSGTAFVVVAVGLAAAAAATRWALPT